MSGNEVVSQFGRWASYHERIMDESCKKMTVLSYSQFIEEIISQADLKNNAYILDAACGPGLISFAMVERYPDIRIEGIDITETMLAEAEKGRSQIERGEHINFQKASVEEIPFAEDTFDIAICSMVLHHTRVEKSVGELVRVTRPEGRVIIADPGLLDHWRRFPGSILWSVILLLFSIRKDWRAERKATFLSQGEWKRLLSKCGLSDIKIKDIGKKNPWILRVFVISAKK